jgi:catechol 2,3-dioxygenase-like lactoylglutathione lyase family enzyme
MTITRVERVVYGVADLDECTRFFEDFGLERGAGTRFATQTGQVVELRAADDAALPPAVEDGSTIREIVWGVDSAEALGELAAELASDREVTAAAGEVHTVDETGFGVGLTVSAPTPWNGDRPGLNRTGAENRWNKAVEHPGGSARSGCATWR